ncbi:hypothetical protein DMB38_20165 [Streptomyces sp. WAC 06738]|uniref:hypothetical protein n=1 Tax=Streptomyces sp. WAC 06738 TaxID=2203210 RepID=UPI000F6C8895|nr:hypothetical protein [Streptomyces sp. WAC 06738]AZM47793.1 hypothetical protein DMB38_20165 [Streptomyces sp. WAC 06738]
MHLLVLALATFFVWECLVRPIIGALCSLLPVPEMVAAYVKSLSALGIAFALERWVDPDFLLPLAAASIAGTLHLLSRSSESPRIATVTRGRARRGMPMPGP